MKHTDNKTLNHPPTTQSHNNHTRRQAHTPNYNSERNYPGRKPIYTQTTNLPIQPSPTNPEDNQ